MKNQQAFSLIELLVVVLIIGILSSIALPQYQRAVNETRFATLQNTATPLIKAAHIYRIKNGTWPANFEGLSVTLPKGFNITPAGSKSSCATNKEMFCCLVAENGWSKAIVCGRMDKTFSFHHMFNDRSYCVAKKDNSHATELCSSLGTAHNSWGAFFPDEMTSTGQYGYYILKEQ